MYLETLTRHRRALHRIPEIMFDLPETQAYVLSALKGLSCEVETVAGCGVLAYFDAGKRETVAFRADMDALRVTEDTKNGFPSQHPGCMHACGHDGHMAMLLAFSEWVNANISRLERNVLLIFQPSEESGAGGSKVVESGCLEKRGVTRAFAIHVEPDLPMGVVASRPGPLMARATELFLDVTGSAGHAAVPGAGRDALAAAVDFIYGAYEAERTLPKIKPRRMKFCQIISGHTTNVIAAEAHVMGTMRTFDEGDYAPLMSAMENLAKKAEADYGVKADFRIFDGYPAVINDAELFGKARGLMPIELLPEPSFLGEDFAYYGKKVPAVMFRVGLGTGLPLHSARFDFDERALETGVDLFIKLAEME